MNPGQGDQPSPADPRMTDRDPMTLVEGLDLSPYRLPLRQPWASARGTRRERRGWLLRLRAEGLCGYGDCAPLPEAGTEHEEDAGAALCFWQAGVPGQPLAALLDRVRRPPSGPGATPAAYFALESALADLAAKQAGVPLRRWLAPEASDEVPVNATLGTLRDQTPERIVAACQAGYQVLKLKVGLGAPDAEIAHLRQLATHLPAGATLRLDANGAWDYDQAARLIDRLNELPVESLEEPLRVPHWQALRRLQAQASFPLALDESLHLPALLVPDPATAGMIGGGPAHAIRGLASGPSLKLGTGAQIEPPRGPARLIPDQDPEGIGAEGMFPLDGLLSAGDPPVRRLVLKPATFGGLQRTLSLARAATNLGFEVVLTSLIESAAGLWPSLQLAAALSSPIPQGLATSSWLAHDLGRVPDPEQGRIWLGQHRGSGFIPRGLADPDAPD